MDKTITKLPPAKIQIPKLLWTAGYARVSCGKDTMLHSLSEQISYYSAMIQGHPDWGYVGVYADEALTGTKDDRPDFQRLLADCRAGKIDQVITKSISRFARNTVTLLETVRELKKLGIDVYFENENIHSMSGDGELMLSILASYAQEESRSVSENCKWRIRNDFKKGKPVFFRMYGYRWVNETLVVVPEEAEVVRLIYSLFLQGRGRALIARELNERGIKSFNGGLWSEHSIANVLSNEKYTGEMLLQKYHYPDHLTKQKLKNNGELTQYLVLDSHEAIIDKATFERVRVETERRIQRFHPPRAPHARYPFSGIIRCAQCGTFYRRKINSAGTKYAKPVWICDTFNRRGKKFCASHMVPETVLMTETAAALGWQGFQEELVPQLVERIEITDDRSLAFHLKDGCVIPRVWQARSRRESWTDEMRQQAREHAVKGRESRV